MVHCFQNFITVKSCKNCTEGEGGKELLQTVKRRKANCSGYMLRRSDLLKFLIEGKIEGTEKT